jgi:hypothetical protein
VWQIEVFDINVLELGVDAFLCNLVDPAGYRFTVSAWTSAPEDNGYLYYHFEIIPARSLPTVEIADCMLNLSGFTKLITLVAPTSYCC